MVYLSTSCFIGKDVLAKAKTGTGKTVAFLVKHLFCGSISACWHWIKRWLCSNKFIIIDGFLCPSSTHWFQMRNHCRTCRWQNSQSYKWGSWVTVLKSKMLYFILLTYFSSFSISFIFYFCKFQLPSIEVVIKSPAIGRDQKRPPIYVLVICPTRELACQAAAEANTLLKYHPEIGVQVVIGGTRLALEQKRMQANPCQVCLFYFIYFIFYFYLYLFK